MNNTDFRELRQKIDSLKKENPTALETVRKLLTHKKIKIVLAAALSLGVTSTTVNMIEKVIQNAATDNKDNILNKKYQITDEATFKALYEASLPLAQLAMLPTEIMVNKPYADRNGRSANTVGLGSFYYPEDGNPESSNWIKVSSYVKKHPDLTVSYKDALKLVDGWFRHREGGRVYKNMYNRLKGCEITAFEMAAAMGCMYNNETNGRNFCEYIAEHHDNPISCAAKLMNYDAQKGFQVGILRRHTHEALLYLNLNNYAAEMLKLKIEEKVSPGGKKYYATSISQLNEKDCLNMKDLLESGDVTGANNVLQGIKGFICEEGQNLHQLICLNLDNLQDREVFFRYADAPLELPDIDFSKEYARYVSELEKGKYDKAIKGFNHLYDCGYDNAALRLSMAKTYSGLKQYDLCIQECRNILNAGKSDYYAEANNLAGLAYEKSGNFEKAEANFRIAQKYQKDNPSYNENLRRMEKHRNNNATNYSSSRKNTRKVQQR